MTTHIERLPPQLTRTVNSWLDQLLEGPAASDWCLLEKYAEDSHEQDIEARLAIGNGSFGIRASLEQPLLVSRPATLIAGFFEMLDRAPRIPALVVTPDWLRFRLWLDEEPVEIHSGETLTYWRALDLRRGLLLSEWQQRTPGGRVLRLRKLRLASLSARSLAIQLARIVVEQPSRIRLETDIRAAPGLQLVAGTPDVLVWRTPSDAGRLAVAFSTQRTASGPVALDRTDAQRQTWNWFANPHEPSTLVRRVSLAHGKCADHDIAERATRSLRHAKRRGVPQLIRDHVKGWEQRWRAGGVEIDGDPSAQKALRFAVYHLVSAANPDDEHVSIGARGLTGEGYLGHVFWDTEIFLLPFYTLTWPQAARAMLMYRYHTLPAARDKAARLGYRGALYAWESADTGDEATPPWALGRDGRVVPILCGTQEQHISADIAHAVWRYWQATGDLRFLLDAGAEIILETARFWASRATREADERYHIRGVIGPDEYHDTVDDNAYTNGLAAWNLDRALMIAAYVRSRWAAEWAQLSQKLNLTGFELDSWRDIADRLATGFDPASGLLEQFAGFFDLEDVDLGAYASRTTPMDVVLGPERTRRSQVIKQADVLMLMALLPDEYDRQVQLGNFRYYEPRCGHGSSLSPTIHALLAARVGEIPLAEQYFRQAASIDMDDARGDTGLGVHMGALGGLWQATVFGFGGLSVGRSGVRLDPRLLPLWSRLAFRVRWRGRALHFEIVREPARVSASLERGRPLRVEVHGIAQRISSSTPVVWDVEDQK
jgi:trehalose/maltose hydrolase-like predicted phosphorylase